MRLLERDAFIATLAADWQAAASGAGRAVLVGGEAGIGKTSLLERFVRERRDGRVLWGACEALSTPHPLGPLHDIAADAQGRLGALLAQEGDRAALFDAVLEELRAPPSPVLLVLEDVHWADAATLDLVRFLGRRIHRAPALLVLTYRDDEVDAAHPLRATLGHLPARHVTRLQLPPLSPEAVATLARQVRRSDAGLHAVTGGNPFFVTEILANPHGGIPATVRDAVAGRAASLTPAAREVLEFASIVPRAVEMALVDAVLGPETRALEQCLMGGLLVAENGLFRFRHELARVAVERSIPEPRRRRLHASALAVLAAWPRERAPLARLVHHAHEAGDGDAVLRFAPQAAAEAAARGARREAAAHCRVALACAGGLPGPQRAALLEQYAAHCFELSDLETAIGASEAAIALHEAAGDVARQSRALAAHAMLQVRALRNAEADAASRRAIALAESLPPGPELARACATESYLRMLNRDYREAVAWGERAIAIAAPLRDAEILAAAHNSMGAALFFVDHARGIAHVRESLEIARGLPDGGASVADAYVMLGTASGEVCRFEDADRYLEEGIAFARARDLDRLADYMEAWQALVDVYRGRWEAAGERANAVLGRERSGSTNRVMALVALGRLRTRRGDPGAAAVLDEALGLASRSGTLQRLAPVRCTRAESAWLAGDVQAVRAEVGAVFELARAKRHPWFAGELAYWLWKAGDAAPLPEACAEPYALQVRGRWREAAQAWEALGCPYEQARALAEGDEAARLEALAVLDRLGARALAERVRRQMREAGVPSVPRGPRAATRSNAAGLTARELQVLLLVAQGWPNARIAEHLSRSTRTVEHHLEAILSKLRSGTRGEAVAAARRRGILPQD